MPSAVNQNIVVVMPAYNENGMVRKTTESLLQQGILTVIIVDDGSETPVIHFVNDLPVIVLRHKINLGQGAALQTGFSHAKN